MHNTDLTDLVNEAKERSAILTHVDSSTNECWHVYANGCVECFDCDAGHLTEEEYFRLVKWMMGKVAQR